MKSEEEIEAMVQQLWDLAEEHAKKMRKPGYIRPEWLPNIDERLKENLRRTLREHFNKE